MRNRIGTVHGVREFRGEPWNKQKWIVRAQHRRRREAGGRGSEVSERASERERERADGVGESEKEGASERERDGRRERDERERGQEGERDRTIRAGQRDDHDARRRAQAARGTGLRAEGSTGPRIAFTGRLRPSQRAMEQPKTPASRLLNTTCIENKDELEEVT